LRVVILLSCVFPSELISLLPALVFLGVVGEFWICNLPFCAFVSVVVTSLLCDLDFLAVVLFFGADISLGEFCCQFSLHFYFVASFFFLGWLFIFFFYIIFVE